MKKMKIKDTPIGGLLPKEWRTHPYLLEVSNTEIDLDDIVEVDVEKLANFIAHSTNITIGVATELSQAIAKASVLRWKEKI